MNSLDKAREKGSFGLGAKHYAAKFTEEDVLSIRARRANGEKTTTLAKEYGVSQSAIAAIVSRRNWKHI